MNTMSRRRRPSSTRGSPEELSTMIKVAASRGRNARALAGAFGACGSSTVMRCGSVIAPRLSYRALRPVSSHRHMPEFADRWILVTLGLRRGQASTGMTMLPPSTRSRPSEAPPEAAALRQGACGAALALALRQHLEAQRTGRRDRLDELDPHAVAQPVGLARAVADQRVAILVMAIVVVAD